MIRLSALLTIASLLGATGLYADFSYEQSTEITGGVMKSAMRMAGPFAKKANQPTAMRIVFKGTRNAQISEETITITDIEAETITTIERKKKRYSVVTFEQMRQYMEKMAAKAKQKKAERGAEVDIQMKVEETDETKTIAGRDARAYKMTVQMQGMDPQSGQAGTIEMKMTSWMVDPDSGYDEVQQYYQAYGQKLNWAPGSALSIFSQGNPGASEGVGKFYEEAAKLKGMPVQQVMTMGPEGHEVQPEGAEGEQESIGSAIKKGFGGFGGFGKKKEQPESADQEQAANPSGAPAALMEVTVTFSNHSNADVDASLVDTEPEGFKKVKSEIEKALD